MQPPSRLLRNKRTHFAKLQTGNKPKVYAREQVYLVPLSKSKFTPRKHHKDPADRF